MALLGKLLKIIKMQPKKEYVVNLIVVYGCVTLNVI